MSRHLKLSNGTVWPRPELEDDSTDTLWKLVYAPDALSKEERLWLASVGRAYNYLLVSSTGRERNQIVREAREQIRREG